MRTSSCHFSNAFTTTISSCTSGTYWPQKNTCKSRITSLPNCWKEPAPTTKPFCAKTWAKTPSTLSKNNHPNTLLLTFSAAQTTAQNHRSPNSKSPPQLPILSTKALSFPNQTRTNSPKTITLFSSKLLTPVMVSSTFIMIFADIKKDMKTETSTTGLSGPNTGSNLLIGLIPFMKSLKMSKPAKKIYRKRTTCSIKHFPSSNPQQSTTAATSHSFKSFPLTAASPQLPAPQKPKIEEACWRARPQWNK